MWNRLIAVVEEQAQTMIRTAFSPHGAGGRRSFGRHLRPQGPDDGAGGDRHARTRQFDGRERRSLPAQIPVPRPCGREIIYITNDPWLGTGHLHDLTVVTPAFRRGRIVGLFANTAHVIDVGGLGMGPEGRSVFEEGLYIPIVKCFGRGAPNETFFDFIRAGSRLPIELEGDVYSLCACNDAGAARLVGMMDEFGMDEPGRTRRSDL